MYRYIKAKDKKMSVKCWAFVPMSSVKLGASAAVSTLVKPADPRRRKIKPFNKGAPDVRVRFLAVE